jgi:hypothetical protein
LRHNLKRGELGSKERLTFNYVAGTEGLATTTATATTTFRRHGNSLRTTLIYG